MTTKKERRLSVRMERTRDAETLKWVEGVARTLQVTPSWVVRWALEEVKSRGLAPLRATPEVVRAKGGA